MQVTKEKNPASIMGDYLLSGWTMLGDHCHQCNIPLMRRQKVTTCVSCGMEEKEGINNNSKKSSKLQTKKKPISVKVQKKKTQENNNLVLDVGVKEISEILNKQMVLALNEILNGDLSEVNKIKEMNSLVNGTIFEKLLTGSKN